MSTAPHMLKADLEQVWSYLRALYEPEDVLQWQLIPKPNPRSGLLDRVTVQCAAITEKHLRRWERLNNAPQWGNVYVITNPLRAYQERPAQQEDVGLVRHLWLDLDEMEPEALVQRCDQAGWPPPAVVVATGGVERAGRGCHGFFKLKTPCTLERSPAGEAVGGYVRECVRAMLVALGDHTETYDLKRLLRPPGFWNVKNHDKCEPRPARLIRCDVEAERWSLEEWGKVLNVGWDPRRRLRSGVTHRPGASSAGPAPAGERQTRPLRQWPGILAECRWAQWCVLAAQKPGESASTGTELREPDYYALLSILANCQDGRMLAHDICKTFPTYAPAAIDAKFDQAAATADARTCQYVEANLGPAADRGSLCRECPHHGQVKSPVVLGGPRRPSERSAKALRAALSEQLAAGNAGELVQATLKDAWTMENLAWLARNAVGELQALLTELVERGGARQRVVDDLAKAIDKVAKRQELDAKRREFRKASEHEKVLAALPGAPASSEAMVPHGWALGSGGIMKEVHPRGSDTTILQPVSSTPMILTGCLRDVDSGCWYTRVAWSGRRSWQQMTFPRKVLANSTEIIPALSEQGLDVHSANKLDVVRYAAAYEGLNRKNLPAIECASTLGWHPGPVFLLGEQIISERGREPVASDDPQKWQAGSVAFRAASQGDAQYVAAYHAHGTMEEWLKAVERIADNPLALIGVYAALASPLLHLLRQEPLIFEWAGRTSTGKTTALRLAASCCGNPCEGGGETLITPWNMTKNSMARRAATVCHLPLFYDDTKKARDLDELPAIIYEFSGGKERGRAGREREGMQVEGYWRNVLLSTGEDKITELGKRQEGSNVRVLTVWGSPFREQTEEAGQAVEQLSQAIDEHYGHLMPAYLEYLLRHVGEVAAWREQHEAVRRDFVAQCHERLKDQANLAHRLTGHLATLQLAANLVHAAVALPWDPPDFWQALGPAVLEGAQGADVARYAMELLIEDAVARRDHYFDGVHPGRAPITGWRGRWDSGPEAPICWTTETARRVLDTVGIDLRRVVRAWLDNDWLVRRADGRAAVTKRLGGNEAIPMYVVASEVVRLIQGESEGEPVPRGIPEQQALAEGQW